MNVNFIVKYLKELTSAATEFKENLTKVEEKYRKYLEILDHIVNFSDKTKWEDFTEKESETGITLFGGKISDIVKSEPKITLVIRCSKGNDLTYKAAELKNNLRTRYKLQ